MIPKFYIPRPEWTDAIERIGELLGRVGALEQVAPGNLELRRSNRIGSVHSSTAIEGNSLTLAQVEAIANSVPTFGPPREVVEVRNALAAYDALPELDPWDITDFLRAHQLLTQGLIAQAGEFRTVDVEIVHPDGTVLHTGSRVAKVPRLVAETLEYGQRSDDHPLVVSSAVHFLIEHIHSFRDGNGRIGRLWQTLILSRWRPIFAWLPTETLIRRNQRSSYEALQASREPEIDAAAFIEFMLATVTNSLAAYEAQAQQHVGVNVGVNVGVSEQIMKNLQRDPTLSAAALAALIGKSARTIERHLADLSAAGRLRRDGSAKTGRWIVIDS